VLLLLIGTAPALAGKPGATLPACPSSFTLSGRSSLSHECLWTPTQIVDLGRIEVEVTEGALVKLNIMVRDHAPGDHCTLTPCPDGRAAAYPADVAPDGAVWYADAAGVHVLESP